MSVTPAITYELSYCVGYNSSTWNTQGITPTDTRPTWQHVYTGGMGHITIQSAAMGQSVTEAAFPAWNATCDGTQFTCQTINVTCTVTHINSNDIYKW